MMDYQEMIEVLAKVVELIESNAFTPLQQQDALPKLREIAETLADE